jgi:hypothetical protein
MPQLSAKRKKGIENSKSGWKKRNLADINNNENFKNVGTQTSEFYTHYKSSSDNITYENIKDMCDIFIDSLPEWTSLNNRFVFVLNKIQ